MAEHTISVVMPTYNGASYIEGTLRSLLDQGPALHEVILIDDGSTDRTLEIARTFETALPLRIVERPRVGNWVVNTNYGICESVGEFVTILHQDDLWLPARLHQVVKCLHRNPECGVFLNPSRYVDPRGRTIGRWTAPLPAGRLLSGDRVRESLIVQNFISMPGPIFRRSLLRPEIECSGAPMDSSLWFTADWNLWLTLCERATWFYHPQPLSCFRVHPESLTARAVVDERYRQQFFQVIERFSPGLGTGALADERRALAQFSMQVNIFLASAFAGSGQGGRQVLRSAVRLGPRRFAQYWRLSRIGERLLARLRALIGARVRAMLVLPRCLREISTEVRP